MRMNPSNESKICPKPLAEYAPDDPCHRYALRRELLCSTVFEGNRAAAARWDVFVAVTSAAFAGGVVAVIVLTLVMTPRTSLHEGVVAESSSRTSHVLPPREAFHMNSPSVAFDVNREIFFERVVGR